MPGIDALNLTGNSADVVEDITALLTKSLSPYIATIDRNNKSINFARLKDLKVSGVVIEAGYLFTPSHNQVSEYRNPLLKMQCTGTTSAKLPFGLYAVSRARSTAEAKKEIENLSMCIRLYPPQIGVWLVPDFSVTKKMADSIVTDYYNAFLNLGLKGQIGFYATERQLKTFSYDKFANNWHLWLVKHLSSIEPINEIMTPETFKVE